MLQFQNDAHYTMQEMYALSYNGLGNYYAGAPTQAPPAGPDRDYVAQNPRGLANGGNGAADDDEVPDLCRFVEEVQWYTGSRQIDIVTHSWGETIARRFMTDYPSLARDVAAFVGIAGANHGTSVCRALDSSYYGCNEIAPGSSWLADLNGPGGSRETYAPTAWMTVYNGAAGDPFFDRRWTRALPPSAGPPTSPSRAPTTTICAATRPRWTPTWRSCWPTDRPAPVPTAPAGPRPWRWRERRPTASPASSAACRP